ncbi:non-ribosomal peptide synthetase [Rubrobacter indicoceani]|uniref:non-ribosomal peptide synthetase n=1 Tax=Rubrobacter indicoceani TaxID=2051957 RepID=UPI0013C42BEA|nr:non-ribosomal peptide synthetase [Rubrobacter indicoceani]
MRTLGQLGSDTRLYPDRPPCLHELFREQARRTPDAPALAGDSGDTSYRRLDGLSDALAGALSEAGVGRDTPVGIYMERSPEYVVSMLAALKAGGAFLPLELAYPKAMVREVVSDSSVSVVLTKDRYAGELEPGVKVVKLDDGWSEALSPSTSPPEVSPDSLAFISYSSGTTGKPKGIANPHRAAVGSYLWRFGVDAPVPGDRVGCNVFFIWEALRPLLCGATTVVIPDRVIYSPDELLDFLRSYRVSETLVTPSLLETVLNRHEKTLKNSLPGLKTLWLNGEVVQKRLVERASEALPQTRLLNVYSISEAHEVAAGDLRELADLPGSTYCAVGRPADSETTRILDHELEAVPPGEAGELYVGGKWLAREYVNLPEKTAERFFRDPASGERIYRTGDRARFLPGGELEILGRADFMVKVRGYSIELGAVETAIEAALPVKGCCVVASDEEGGDKRLVAYLVPDAGEELPDISAGTGRSAGIREALKEALPHYAIPAVYIELDALPLQATTGKVDRAELPPPPERSAGSRRERGIRLPDSPSPAEQTEAIRAIFEAVLGLDPGDVDETEDFFEIGGHSLAAAEVLSLMEETFGVGVKIPTLLDNPTPAKLRDAISRPESGPEPQKTGPDPREDAKLDSDISPAEPANPRRITEADGIFVTGATGFLGAFLLRELLEGTAAEVRCLVRRHGERGERTSITPVRDNLRRYGLWRPGYSSRLKPVPGDLGEPLLGLDRKDFDALAGSVEVVVHAAASVNLVYPYSSLRAANVEGTREVLRLCTTGTSKTLHHVSTNGVFPPGHGVCREDEELQPLVDDLEDGYGQSKWAAERLVLQARERGLPAFVYRPGNIGGDTESGAYNPKDLLSAAVSASLDLGLVPEPEENSDAWRVEMTPVDFVAGAISHIADGVSGLNGERVFHLADPSPPTAAEFFDRLARKTGRSLEPVPLPEWLARLAEADVPNLTRAVIGSGETLSHAFGTGNISDDANTRAALAASGADLERPSLDAAPLDRYAAALQRARGTV